MSIAEKLIEIAENEKEVYKAGKNCQRDEFWEAFQEGGKRNVYRYAFYGKNWKDEVYNPKYPIICSETAQDMFYTTGITDTKVDIIVSYEKQTRLFSSEYLETIRKLIVSDIVTYGSWFNNSYSLKNIIIEGVIGNDIDLHWSPLTKESIISIINALSTTTLDRTVSFKKTAINNAFQIDIDNETTYPEGSEFYNLRNSKSNWNFSFV